MCKHSRGDILWGVVVHSDVTGYKARPVIVINVNKENCNYLVVPCYSLLDRHKKLRGIVVKEGDRYFSECGFDKDTFVACQDKCWIRERFLLKHPVTGAKPMGVCNFVNDVEKC